MFDIQFTSAAKRTIAKCKKSNPSFFKKLSAVLEEMQNTPRAGIGHPEPLRGGGGITYSRRITAHDRIIYDIYDDRVVVLVISVEGHYNDK